MSYDKNGNVSYLARNGKTATGFWGIDRLFYAYSGNRLTSVADFIATDNEVDFVQRGGGGYTYYPDGSLKSDANEQIQNTTYDTFLKQPTAVVLTDGRKIRHFYDGGGRLIKTVYYDAANAVLETWEFVGQLILKNGVPYQMSTPDGRAVYNNTTSQWEYEFEYTDHLGNTRVSFKAQNGQLLKTAETAFGPWGLKLAGVGSVNGFQNRWELQGKEREQTFGLNRVNFGARTYNPTIGRFDRIDAMSEKYYGYSPFNYVLNNPTNLFDPDGNEPCCGDDLEKALGNWNLSSNISKGLNDLAGKILSYTDFNDATVLATSITRGSNAVNLDGTKATAADKGTALLGAFVPIVSGSAVKKVAGAVIDNISDAIRSIDGYATGSHKALNTAKLKDSHHIIQDAAVRDLPSYSRKEAPAVQLKGPSTKVGTPHYNATQAQRQSGGGTYASERRIGYRALRQAGISQETSKKLIWQADNYFKNIGVTPNTQTRIPGNRN